MFDLDIKVTFNSSWEGNEKEEDALHTTMQAEALASEEAVILPLIESTTEEITEEDVEKASDIIEKIEEVMDEVEDKVEEEEEVEDDGTKDD